MSESKSVRYVFLDVLRALAVLWMIQVHITNVVLAPSLKTDWVFSLLNISNGFVAPTFIFCAGIGLYIALSRKGSTYLSFQQPLWEYLRRLMFILFWAYMLHVPVFSYAGLRELTPDQLLPWLQFDVLQTIVYASLVALALYFIVRDLHRTAIVSGVLSLLIFFVTVFIWQWADRSNLPAFLWYGLSNTTPSGFPFIPWSGYLLAGLYFSDLFFRSANKQRLSKYLVAIGITLPILIFLWKGAQVHTPWKELWWASSPGMFLFRISGIMVGFGGLFLIEHKLNASKWGGTLQILGMESLFLYLSHLQIVYGALTPDIIARLGITNGNYATIAISWVVVTVPLVFAAVVWHRFKKSKPTTARWLLAAQIAGTISLCLVL